VSATLPLSGSSESAWSKRLKVFFGAVPSKLSADSRDLDRADVLWLIGAYIFVLAPHFDRQPLWYGLPIVALLIWRALIATRGWHYAPSIVLTLFVLAAGFATWREHGRLYGRDPGVMLLLGMVAMKLMEMRVTRDVTWAVYLGLFLVVTNFFYSQTVLMALYAIVCVGIFVATMIGFARLASKPTLKERVKPALAMLAWAVPLTIVLFLLVPRIQGPLWRMPDQSRMGKTGLSESMSPGMISELIKSDELAFVVKFDGPVPPSQNLYFRGPVLSNFDGRTWTQDSRLSQDIAPQRLPQLVGGTPNDIVRYTLTLEPSPLPLVTALESAITVPDNLVMTPDYQMRIRTSTSTEVARAAQRRNVTLSSALTGRMEEPVLSALGRAKALPLNSTNPRAIALAKQWRTNAGEGNAGDDEVLAQALRLFNKEFTYTLEPPLLQSKDTVDEFLFTTKRGFCEHYAGSFALLMRAAGIPARVVTGYLGGEFNPYNQTLVVRQSEAHAWTEVYLQGQGWVRIDPTSAVAPIRIQRGLVAELGPLGIFGSIEANDPLGIVAWTRQNWEAFNYQWTQWVINFNDDKQRDLLSSLGMKNPDWQTMAAWLVGSGFVVAALSAAVMLLRLRPQRKHPLRLALDLLDRKLVKLGAPRQASEGLEALSERLAQERPDLWHRVDPVLRALAMSRYRTESSISDIKALIRGL
jgi:protein-glutamine gamma-glutamyltransferase